MKTVLIFGVFDGLHDGHRSLIKQAKKLGDYLVISVAQDSVVKKIKEKSPKFSQKKRIAVLENEKVADKVLFGDKAIGKWKIIEKIKPDIVALGYDQIILKKSLEAVIESFKHKPKVVLLKAFRPQKFHSKIINK